MSNEKTIKIPLKKELKTFDGKKIPDLEGLTEAQKSQYKTQEEMLENAPGLQLGYLMSTMLSASIKPKDAHESKQLQRKARKISERMETAKGEWVVDKDELQDLIKTLEKVEGALASPKYIGEVMIILEDLLFVDTKEEFKKNQQE